MAGKRGGNKRSKKKNSSRRRNNNGARNNDPVDAVRDRRQEEWPVDEETGPAATVDVENNYEVAVDSEGDYELPPYPDPPSKSPRRQPQEQQQEPTTSRARQGQEPPATVTAATGAKFVPLSLVMNKRGSEASSTSALSDDPPGDYGNDATIHKGRDRDVDIEENDATTSYSYSSEESEQRQHQQHNNNSHQQQNNSQQQQQQHKRSREDPRDRTEGDEEDEDVEDYIQHQHEQRHQRQEQSSSHNNHNDRAFAQFNIQPRDQPMQQQQQRRRQTTHSDSEEEEEVFSSSESEDEEAPLFFGTSNFNSASDTYSPEHVDGVEYGVDYQISRAQRKERIRAQQEAQRKERRKRRDEENERLWWWQGNDDESDYEWDDVDGEGGGYYRRYKRSRLAQNVALMIGAIFFVLVFNNIMEKARTKTKDAAVAASNKYHGTAPSSRWGHRFEDNHTSSESITTPQEKAVEMGKWEDYEMNVANLLADAATGGWDIHSKTGNATADEEDENSKDGDGDDNSYADGYHSDEFTDHWVQYYDKSSKGYYYFHRETNATQWEKPVVEKGVVLLGITYGTQREYIIEKAGEEGGSAAPGAASGSLVGQQISDNMGNNGVNGQKMVYNDNNMVTASQVPLIQGNNNNGATATVIAAPTLPPAPQFTGGQEILDHYAESYWRWNHPYRIPDRTEVWGGIDAPVFWRVPLSGATTVEEIFTQCYHMIVAGTTGTSKDGKAVLTHNVSEHLSVLTLDDGAHYLNIDMNTMDGIQTAKHAGLGQSGVADVILTRYLYNAAELFRETGHTGRCFTILRHPVDRAVAMFHHLKRNNVTAVSGMSIAEYAKSPIAEDNWMTRMITNELEGTITPQHLQVAKEILGRKCLVGFLDNISESMDRFTRFFRWEEIKSINTHHSVVPSKEKDLAVKRSCSSNHLKTGVNRHQYIEVPKTHDVWKDLEKKNILDIQLYEYAQALYYKQNVIYEE